MAVTEVAADVLAVGSPAKVEISGFDSGRRACGGDLGVSWAVCTTEPRTVFLGVLRTRVHEPLFRKARGAHQGSGHERRGRTDNAWCKVDIDACGAM